MAVGDGPWSPRPFSIQKTLTPSRVPYLLVEFHNSECQSLECTNIKIVSICGRSLHHSEVFRCYSPKRILKVIPAGGLYKSRGGGAGRLAAGKVSVNSVNRGNIRQHPLAGPGRWNRTAWFLLTKSTRLPTRPIRSTPDGTPRQRESRSSTTALKLLRSYHKSRQ